MLPHGFAGFLVAAVLISSAMAQDHAALIPLPRLDRCDATSRPRLPEKWRATFLMAPFTKSQLVLSHIVYDGSLPAMRVKLHGVRRGSADLLVLGNDTYVLASEGTAIKQCKDLGDTGWRPLPQDWLMSQSQCVGAARIGTTAVDWWKTAIEPAPASYWVWYKSSDRSPFRIEWTARMEQEADDARSVRNSRVRTWAKSTNSPRQRKRRRKTARRPASLGVDKACRAGAAGGLAASGPSRVFGADWI